MTEEQIKQNAEAYADTFCSRYDQNGMWQECCNIFVAGAKSRSPQELFDELDPYQKADFMKNNISWARTCDLRDELKLRQEL